MVVYMGLVEVHGNEFTAYKQSSRPQHGGRETIFEITGAGILIGGFNTTSDVKNDNRSTHCEFTFPSAVIVKTDDKFAVRN